MLPISLGKRKSQSEVQTAWEGTFGEEIPDLLLRLLRCLGFSRGPVQEERQEPALGIPVVESAWQVQHNSYRCLSELELKGVAHVAASRVSLAWRRHLAVCRKPRSNPSIHLHSAVCLC